MKKLKKCCLWLVTAALAFVGAGAVQAAEVHVSDAAGLKNAFANATADTTIVLGADITTKDHLSCSKDCVLDLAGHKIVGDYSSEGTFGSGTLINVTGATSFKLISSASGGGMSTEGANSFSGKNGVAVNLSSTATATFGEADGSNANFTLYGAYQGMNVSGTVIFNGGAFECGEKGVAVQLQSGCNVVLNGGSISSFKGLDSANISIGVDKALACLTSGGSMQLCDIPAEGLDLSYGQVIICVANGKTYKVKQSSTAENKNQLKICAAENTTATVVLDGLCCNNSDTIVCDSGAGSAIVLELDNASTLTGGIRNVGEGELVIQDENGTAGSIKITASGYCAAIGGNQVLSPVGKNITIKSGTIECEAGYGAAIGGGGSTGGNAVNIKILGGTVTAKSDRGAAIGGGTDGHAENVIISGGKVVASSDRGKAVGDGFQSSGSMGISISCGTYSPKPAADMIADGYEAIERDGKFVIGVKISDSTIVTTGTQETTVEVPAGVEITLEDKEKIEQGTKVEGVKLTAVAESSEKKSGLEAVLAAAKEDDDFAKVAEKASEIIVKVDVLVKPAESLAPEKVLFKLEPKATVSVDTGDGIKMKEVPVTNDMIDKNQKISVSIYTGFKPAAIVHDDDDGVRLETFKGDQIAYDEVSGVATVQIGHFSFLGGYLDLADVPVPPVAKIGDDKYMTLADAFDHAGDGAVIEMLMPCELTETLTIDKSITLKTKDLVVTATAGAGLALADGAKVTLDITGDDNAFTGAAGFAGINVPVGTELTITGTGKMVANGGAGASNFGGGAGIGGNGDTASGFRADFGKITFAEGATVQVTANGGMQMASPGGGAGIGAGGSIQRWEDDEALQGAILINGGVIVAQGGNSDGYLGCGGAGIGGGGSEQGTVSAITITINDGTVTANGGTCGAGIGGGGGCDGGTICLMGGKITAAGKVWGDGDTSGGAGIGGGDAAGASSIVIGGTADVEAVGSGIAAGIGSGAYCDVAEIIIQDDAKVKAVGGSYGSRGGAAIGTSGSNAPNTSDDVIKISGNAQVEAIAGTGAEAIGAGQNQKSTNTQKVIDTDSGAQVTLTGEAPTTMKVAEGAKGSIKVPEGGAAAVLVPADESKLPVEVGAGASEQTVNLAEVEYPVAVASLTRTVGGQPVVTRYASLKEAYDATVDGDTITILADFDLTEAFAIDNGGRSNLIIDLNGKKMTLKTVVSTHQNLTFANGSIDVGSPAGGHADEHNWDKLFYVEHNNHQSRELKFDHVTFTYTNKVCTVGIQSSVGTQLTFKDSTLKLANCDKAIYLGGSAANATFDNTVIEAEDVLPYLVHAEGGSFVTFKENTSVTLKGRGGFNSNSTVEMSDTKVVATGMKNPCFNGSSVTLVNNVNISIEGSIDTHGITGGKKLVVGSGCVLDVRNIEYLGMYIGDGSEFKSGSTVIISNCCTTANEGKTAYIGQDIAVWASGNLAIAPDADVRIYGKLVAYGGSGTISIADGRYTSLVQSAATEKFNITGGVYKQEPAKEFIDIWYEAVPNTDAETKAEGYAWMIAKKVPQIVTEPKDPVVIAEAAKVVDQSGNPVSKEGLSDPQKELINTLAEKVVAVQASTVSALTFVKTEIDKSVMNPPTSPDAKPTVKPNIVNGLKDTAINEKHLPEEVVNAQIKTDSDVTNYIDVDITTPEMKLVGSDVNLKALTYDVKPMVKTVVVTQDEAGNDVSNVVERQLANSEIVRPLTFRMPLTSEFVGQNIKVTHSKNAEGTEPVEGSWRTRVYPVKGTGTDVYVEVQSDKFSFFKNELTEENPTQVEVWTGGVWTAVSSLGDAASAASEAAAIRHETGVIIRLVANQTEGCTLPLNVTLQTNGHTIGTVTAEGGFTLTLDENGVYRCIDFGVSDVKVKQRYPWNGLVDISYTLSDSLPSGYDLIVTLEDKSNVQIKYMATTFLAPPTFNKGVNTVVWNAFADLNGLVLRNFKCTIEVKKRLN